MTREEAKAVVIDLEEEYDRYLAEIERYELDMELYGVDVEIWGEEVSIEEALHKASTEASKIHSDIWQIVNENELYAWYCEKYVISEKF